MSNILEITGLCKRFGGFALSDVTFSLPRGFIMGLIGPNGAGKTTTIKSMLGMILPDSGSIKLLGQDAGSAMSPEKDKIGVVMDTPFFVGGWTLSTVGKAVSGFYSRWEHETYSSLLAKFGLDQGKKVEDLSRGMQMKLMIAVALSHNAELLILDEPTSGLDPVARDELMDILREFISDENKGVLFSSHITSDLEKIADFITFIRDGSVVFTGTKDELMESYAIIKGGAGDLTAGQRASVIGYREHATGFDGLIARRDLAGFPECLVQEPASLDDIIVYMTKDGGGNG
jgi:ABC-2 type transport system ATP-binding protein